MENIPNEYNIDYNVYRIFRGLGGLCYANAIDIHKAIAENDISLIYRYFVLEKNPIDGFESLNNDGSLTISDSRKLTFLDDHSHYCEMCNNLFKVDEMAVVTRASLIRLAAIEDWETFTELIVFVKKMYEVAKRMPPLLDS